MEEEDKILNLEDEDEFFDDSSALRRILLVDAKERVVSACSKAVKVSVIKKHKAVHISH